MTIQDSQYRKRNREELIAKRALLAATRYSDKATLAEQDYNNQKKDKAVTLYLNQSNLHIKNYSSQRENLGYLARESLRPLARALISSRVALAAQEVGSIIIMLGNTPRSLAV